MCFCNQKKSVKTPKLVAHFAMFSYLYLFIFFLVLLIYLCVYLSMLSYVIYQLQVYILIKLFPGAGFTLFIILLHVNNYV